MLIGPGKFKYLEEYSVRIVQLCYFIFQCFSVMTIFMLIHLFITSFVPVYEKLPLGNFIICPENPLVHRKNLTS